MAKTIQERAIELSKLGYTIDLLRDKTTDGDYIYVASNPELEGCMVQGLTEEEALQNLDEIRVKHIEHLLEHDLPVPYPSRAIAGVQSTNVVQMELPPITLPDFEDYLIGVNQTNARELVYSKTPNT